MPRAVFACLALACCGGVAIVSTSAPSSQAPIERSAGKRYAAVAFDYFVLFNPDSVISAVEDVVPGKGRDLCAGCTRRAFE